MAVCLLNGSALNRMATTGTCTCKCKLPWCNYLNQATQTKLWDKYLNKPIRSWDQSDEMATHSPWPGYILKSTMFSEPSICKKVVLKLSGWPQFVWLHLNIFTSIECTCTNAIGCLLFFFSVGSWLQFWVKMPLKANTIIYTRSPFSNIWSLKFRAEQVFAFSVSRCQLASPMSQGTKQDEFCRFKRFPLFLEEYWLSL